MIVDDAFTLDPDASGEVTCSACGHVVSENEHVLALFGDSSQRDMCRACLGDFCDTYDPHVRLVEVAPHVVEVLL